MPKQTTTSKPPKVSNRIWSEAIRRAVSRPEGLPPMSTRGPETQRLERLADVLVTKGVDGDIAAIKEIGDRLEGKAAQSIGFGQAEDLDPMQAEIGIRPTLTREAWLKLHAGE